MAQKLKFGNGTWATKEGSTLAYNDEGGNYKPLPFTTTRDSIATRVNKEGLIEVVGKDKLRIDYTDSADGVLLLEPSRTNLHNYSEDFSQSYWTKTASTITPNNAISPNGTLNASKIESSVDGNSRIEILPTVSDSTVYTSSIFVKKGSLNFISLNLRDKTAVTRVAYFDIDNGVVSSTVNSPNDAKIENYGNGWFRVSISVDVGIGTTPVRARVNLSSADGNLTVSVGDYLYIYGAQLEQSSYPTSYIPTSGSTVQRAADTASGAGNSEVFNDSQGVLFANIAALSDDGTNRNITINDNTSDNVVLLKFDNSSNAIEYRVLSSGTLSVAKTATVSDTTLFNKVSVKYKQNDFALWINGFKMGTDTVGSTPIGLIKLDLSNYDEANKLYGKTKEIGYYDEILTDEELEYLTSYRSLNELVTELNLNEL